MFRNIRIINRFAISYSKENKNVQQIALNILPMQHSINFGRGWKGGGDKDGKELENIN